MVYFAPIFWWDLITEAHINKTYGVVISEYEVLSVGVLHLHKSHSLDCKSVYESSFVPSATKYISVFDDIFLNENWYGVIRYKLDLLFPFYLICIVFIVKTAWHGKGWIMVSMGISIRVILWHCRRRCCIFSRYYIMIVWVWAGKCIIFP